MSQTPRKNVNVVPTPGRLRQPGILFEQQHLWFVFLSSVDVLLTHLVLSMGGVEVNGVAAAVINYHGLTGMILFKFAMVVGIIVIIENIGRMRYSTGKRVAEWEVALTCIPVVVSAAQLAFVAITPYWIAGFSPIVG